MDSCYVAAALTGKTPIAFFTPTVTFGNTICQLSLASTGLVTLACRGLYMFLNKISPEFVAILAILA